MRRDEARQSLSVFFALSAGFPVFAPTCSYLGECSKKVLAGQLFVRRGGACVSTLFREARCGS